jgi:hypothetical protein
MPERHNATTASFKRSLASSRAALASWNARANSPAWATLSARLLSATLGSSRIGHQLQELGRVKLLLAGDHIMRLVTTVGAGPNVQGVDRGVTGGASFHVRHLNLRAGSWQPLVSSSQLTSIQLDLSTGTAQRETGKLAFDGAFRWPASGSVTSHEAPLKVKGQLKLTSMMM